MRDPDPFFRTRVIWQEGATRELSRSRAIQSVLYNNDDDEDGQFCRRVITLSLYYYSTMFEKAITYQRSFEREKERSSMENIRKGEEEVQGNPEVLLHPSFECRPQEL